MLRRVLGSLLLIVGAVTVVLAVTGCVWVHLTFHAGQFDLRPVWLVGGGSVILGGAVLTLGLFVLMRKP